MKSILLGIIGVLLTSVIPTAYASQFANSPDAHAPNSTTEPQPVPPPRSNANIKRMIQLMGEVSTAGHPDLFGQFAGLRNLFDGKYKGAMKFFKIGARYADKLSQLSIGMMYLHGRGVSKDPAAACAWITLAAERGYPSYVSARDQVCSELSPAQHEQAALALNMLSPEYGDKVAKQRMKLELTMARTALTGSHLGHDSGVTLMGTDPNPIVNASRCAGYTLNLGGVEIPRNGCGRYDPELFDPKKYFAARDAQWFGTVTVGELRKVNPPRPEAPAKASEQGH